MLKNKHLRKKTRVRQQDKKKKQADSSGTLSSQMKKMQVAKGYVRKKRET